MIHTDQTITTMYGSVPEITITNTQADTTSTEYGYGTQWTTVTDMSYSITTFVLNPPGQSSGMPCSVQAIEFNAKAGELITGEIENESFAAGVDAPFYILTPSQYAAFQNTTTYPGPGTNYPGHTCIPPNYVFSSEDPYAGGWYASFFAPNDGTYYYVFVNPTPGGAGFPITVTFIAGSGGDSLTGGSSSIDLGVTLVIVVAVAVVVVFLLRKRKFLT